MIPGAFAYHRPARLEEAVALLARHGDEARVVAGGHSLIPMMKLRMAAPEHLVDLQALAELRGIAEEGGGLVIGALTSQAELLASPLVARLCPLLPEVAAQIADPQVRGSGTLGGNVANGDPGNDMPAVMQALDARYVLAGPFGRREVAARAFYRSAYVTALEPGEILVAIRIPPLPPGSGAAYAKQKRKTGDYATAAAAAVLRLEGGTCRAAAIALTNLSDVPLLAADAAAALVGTALVGTALEPAAVEAAVAKARAICAPAHDGRGPPEFRIHVAGVMVRRAIALAAERAA